MVHSEPVEDFREFGITAFTTTRAAGSFNTLTTEPVGIVMERWHSLRSELLTLAPRFATARQVHGDAIALHTGEWSGWLRATAADGHFAPSRGTAMAVTVADCVPVFLAHASGATALLHAGWRGAVAELLVRGIEVFRSYGFAAEDLWTHLGPAICGKCYEVSPDVFGLLTGKNTAVPARVDLRGVLASQASRSGVRRISSSPLCTRCNNDRFFSHRAGDEGRQLGVMVAA
ncbi:MAG: polyphenol oxidase family protein [Anaerolineae bacterium]|nr:polyphenol oxidase family protein [Gemmatimonadaceae bacterium]